MAEQALQAAFEIKTACDEISRRLLRWHWEHKPGSHSLGALLDHIAQRRQDHKSLYITIFLPSYSVITSPSLSPADSAA